MLAVMLATIVFSIMLGAFYIATQINSRLRWPSFHRLPRWSYPVILGAVIAVGALGITHIDTGSASGTGTAYASYHYWWSLDTPPYGMEPGTWAYQYNHAQYRCNDEIITITGYDPVYAQNRTWYSTGGGTLSWVSPSYSYWRYHRGVDGVVCG